MVKGVKRYLVELFVNGDIVNLVVGRDSSSCGEGYKNWFYVSWWFNGVWSGFGFNRRKCICLNW